MGNETRLLWRFGWDGVNFPTAALTVLSREKGVENLVVFGSCWAVLPQHQGCLSKPASTSPKRPLWWVCAGAWARAADPSRQKGNPIPYSICSAIKAKAEVGRRSIFMGFVFWGNHCVYCKPWFLGSVRHWLLMGSRELNSFFLLLLHP